MISSQDGIAYAVQPSPPEPPVGLFDLLCRAFDEPPYDDVPAKMRKRMEHWGAFAAIPGFRVVTARDRRGGRLLGAAFGWDEVFGTPAEPELFAGLYRRLRELPWHGRLSGSEVVELAVDPAARGLGVGQAILTRLVDDGPAWLLADDRSPAHDWYVRRGWVPVGRVDDQGPYVALTRG